MVSLSSIKITYDFISRKATLKNKSFFDRYKNKPALLLKEHPELKKELMEKENVLFNKLFKKPTYFDKYNQWLLNIVCR